MAQQLKNQHHRLLRHRVCVAPLTVTDIDAPLFCRGKVDAVESDSLGMDQPQIRHFGNQRRIHRADGIDAEDLGIPSRCQQLGIAAPPAAEGQFNTIKRRILRQKFFIARPRSLH